MPALVCLSLVAGCSSTMPTRGPKAPTSFAAPNGPKGPEELLPRAGTTAKTDDVRRLKAVYTERTQTAHDQEYPIGPGDIIEVSVPAMTEIQEEIVRVSSDGTIKLPLLGTIRAGGRTERQLHDEIRAALARYMHHPEFALIVKEHNNRQVGVLGAVAEPGLHPVDSGTDTILEMISKAGGLTDDATQRLLFIPVEKVNQAEAVQLQQAGQVVQQATARNLMGQTSRPTQLVKASKPIVVDLEKMNRHSQQLAMSTPVRPGDTIMVLGGGKIFVQGWVEEPGAYEMKRGMTVLAAVAEAGGVSYPAKKNTVQILRESGGSEREVLVVDLNQIEDGLAHDVPLREGDIIEVDSTGAKLAAYGVYHFFTNVMRMGLALTPF